MKTLHMKKHLTLIVLCAISLLHLHALAQEPVKPCTPSKGYQTRQGLAEGCLASSAYADLDINNVRARINASGDHWWDLQGNGQYFIPKNSYKRSMFSSAIWIGGLSDNGQLKLAAQRYRGDGVDFFPGPLSTDGLAATDAYSCMDWDHVFVFYSRQVEEFIAAFREDPSLSKYQVPDFIKNYPAHGDPARLQSFYLAPFYDYDGNGVYDYTKGDYPYYDFGHQHCNINRPPGLPVETGMGGSGLLADQILQGHQTLWWVFNDNGNLHFETHGEAIGLEIRAQAFAWEGHDELNNATFYNYEIINRSNQRLNQTWFGQFADCDLGDAYDDYVGSDVYRGLGYCYNGVDPDGSGRPQDYGAQPPAVGVDFYRGPYMDADGVDNPRYDGFGELVCGYGINGSNFSDGIIDNERYGMCHFVYFNGLGGFWGMTAPGEAQEYYNFLRGIWKDGERMKYWGNAHPMAGGNGPECRFMFPGDSDPCMWGTNGIHPGAPYPDQYWTEPQAGNDPYDRRFVMSAGPFTLEPGGVNYVCLGVPWARAVSGGPMASVELLKLADDKFQALFDNCFILPEGPDAPDLSIQELDRELILYISNRKHVSNNYVNRPEDYAAVDYRIIFPEDMPAAERSDSAYRFEGYQIYQLKNASVTVDDLHDPDLARLVAQCDIRNGVKQLVNFYYDPDLNASVPREEVNGADAGIVHSFRIFDDLFASDDKRLVNHKQYYYLAIAYAYNSYAPYDPNDPLRLNGQKQPYLAGTRSAAGTITVQTGIPHIPSPEAGGTITHSEYGVRPVIRRLEGQGNGGMVIDLSQESLQEIITMGYAGELEYTYNKGPVNIKVVDPLNVPAADYILKFIPPSSGRIDSCNWLLTDITTGVSWTSDMSISTAYEQLIPELGLSIHIEQVLKPGMNLPINNGFLEASIYFADSTRQWLSGISDYDAYPAFNWIRSGMYTDPIESANDDFDPGSAENPKWLDPGEAFEKVLAGTWAPYALASYITNGPAFQVNQIYATKASVLGNIASVDLIITADRSKWSRCPVFEMCEDPILSEGNIAKHELRAGSTDGEQGMGWFPGYAINVETGERLNMAFGEDSWLANENGRDMKWNPTSGLVSNFGDILFGGKHWVYIFGHNRDSVSSIYGRIDCPAYDGGAWIKEAMLKPTFHDRHRSFIFKDAMWVGAPLTTFTGNWDPEQIPCDVRIRIRVGKPYQRFWSARNQGPAIPVNNNYPCYGFSTAGIAVSTQNSMAAEGSLALINVVPNPYYAYSAYEAGEQQMAVRITNLPQKCSITIYSMQGKKIREILKDDALPYYEWDLTNQNQVQIAGGIYLICVDIEGVGQSVVKWFGAMRPGGVNPF